MLVGLAKLFLHETLLSTVQTFSLFPPSPQVVYDGLFGANTNNKLLSLTLQFVHHICMV